MAADLKKETIVILRMDGEELEEFLESPNFEAEVTDSLSQIDLSNLTLQKCVTIVLEKLTVDHGMPPISDSWVNENLVEPALKLSSAHELEKAASPEICLAELEKTLKSIGKRLKENPVIVAHTEKFYDGSEIKELLSDPPELEKVLEMAWEGLQKDAIGVPSDDHIRYVRDAILQFGLSPHGASDQIEEIIEKFFRTVNSEWKKNVSREEFKNLVREILESIMLQLEGNPVSVSTNSVIHEPLISSTSPQNSTLDE